MMLINHCSTLVRLLAGRSVLRGVGALVLAGALVLPGGVYAQTAATDKAALEAFYDATGGDRWTNKSGWKGTGAIGTWRGVTTDGSGRVTEIELSNNNLTGSIPSSLGNLTRLSELNIEANNLSGSIPASLGNLTSLTRLSLDDNNLSGSIPPELGNLTNLLRLDLRVNNLSSSIPSSLGNLTRVTNLYLNTNNLSGSIPPELGRLTPMRTMHLHQNNLSGSIPPELGRLTNVRSLDLSQNNLSGAVPSELGNLSSILHLFLGWNIHLRGPLPASFTNRTSITRFGVNDTELCAPTTTAFQAWVTARPFSLPSCSTDRPIGPITLSLSAPPFNPDNPAWVGRRRGLEVLRIREDGGTVEVKVTAKADSAMKADTAINLQLASGQTGLNTRFRISLPTIVIAKDKKEGTGTIRFTPINDTLKGDLYIDIGGQVDTRNLIRRIGIVLLDDDKASESIYYLGSINGQGQAKAGLVELSKAAGATDVEVAAVLDGAPLTTDQTLPLAFAPSVLPEARRDIDYSGRLGSLTIRRGKPTGMATVSITPRNKGVGYIGITKPLSSYPALGATALAIQLKDVPAVGTKELTATPSAVREEAGRTAIALKLTLDKAVSKETSVSFSIIQIPSTETNVQNVARDVDYAADFSSLTLATGQKEGTATLTLTPVNDTKVNSIPRKIRVQAQVGASMKTVDITLIDDESQSTKVTLAAQPASLNEDAGASEVAITATLDGKVFAQATTLTLVLGAGTATRDVDYTAVMGSVTIPAGQVQGTGTITITPLTDTPKDNDETVIVTVMDGSIPKNADDVKLTVGTATIKLKDVPLTAPPGDSTPVFAEADINAASTAIEGRVGSPLSKVFPTATGDAPFTYTISTLPAGLSFDRATRTLSGTPVATDTTRITYTVVDGDTGTDLPSESTVLRYTLHIAEAAPLTVSVARVTATHTSLRENGNATQIGVTATFAAPVRAAETIRFALVAPSVGTPAVRDLDYTASMDGSIAVAVGDTEATTTLTLTPINNTTADGHRALGIRATASGGSASTDITITDDETASTSISLSASPHTVSESAERTSITITAALDGKGLDADAIIMLSIDPASVAIRDLDYAALFESQITLRAGETSASSTFLIDPTADGVAEGSETITLIGTSAGLTSGTGVITITDAAAAVMPPLAFAAGAMIADIAATAGTAIQAVELPMASGGSGTITYSVSTLPDGLVFDAATRTLSGTPTAAGTTEVTYTATDANQAAVTLTFTITVNPALEFGDIGDLFGAFNNGAGKANPADDGALPK